MYFCSFTFYYGHFSGGAGVVFCGGCGSDGGGFVVGSGGGGGPHQTSSSGRGTLLLEGGSLPLSLSLTKYNL